MRVTMEGTPLLDILHEVHGVGVGDSTVEIAAPNEFRQIIKLSARLGDADGVIDGRRGRTGEALKGSGAHAAPSEQRFRAKS